MNLHSAAFATAKLSSSLRERLFATRALSSELARPLSDEDQVVQAMDDASPTKWHLAHTTWFFEAFLLKRFLEGYRVFDERFEYCFNSYYESVGPRHPRPKRGLLTRPGAAEVRAYRAFVDAALDRLFESDLAPAAAVLIELGINHEQQHQELLLTDILSLFAAEPLKPAYRDAGPGVAVGEAAPAHWVPFDGGIVAVGHDGDGFAYDNEGPRHEALIRPFKLASRSVTSAEWMAFIADGGYATPTLWLADGWNVVRGIGAGRSIGKNRGGAAQMSLNGYRPVDPRHRHHVSYYEADARQMGGRASPTEFEWEAAAASVPLEGRMFMPVICGRWRQRAAKAEQMIGDVWSGREALTCPTRASARAGAVGEYNGKFMQPVRAQGRLLRDAEGHIRRTIVPSPASALALHRLAPGAGRVSGAA
jgi:ergothioneine biosynthesis protein EgtB